MSIGILIIIACAVIGACIAIPFVLISKRGLDSFSMWNNEMFEKNDKKDNCEEGPRND